MAGDALRASIIRSSALSALWCSLFFVPLACGGRSNSHGNARGDEATGGVAGDSGSGGSVSTGGGGPAGNAGNSGAAGAGGTIEPDADISVDLADAWGSLWMLFSEEAGAVAVYRTRTQGQALRRFRRGTWEQELSIPDPGRFAGGALGPDGTANFTFTADAEFEVVNVFTQALGYNDVWSAQFRLGDSDVGWWQDPVIPKPAVAADETGLRMLLWSRMASENDPTHGVVETHTDVIASWTSASLIDPSSRGATAPLLALPGDGTAVAAWAGPTDEGRRVFLGIYRQDGWTLRVVDESPDSTSEFAVLAITPLPDGSVRVLYRYSDASGHELRAREVPAVETDFAGTLILASLPASYVYFDAATAPDGAAFVTWTLEDVSGTCQGEVHGAFHSLVNAWSEPSLLSGGGWHRIAIRSDGRAAIAYPALSRESPTQPGCIARGVTVRRYAPDTGWDEPLTLDTEARAITALGYAEDRLLVGWERPNRGFVKTLDP